MRVRNAFAEPLKPAASAFRQTNLATFSHPFSKSTTRTSKPKAQAVESFEATIHPDDLELFLTERDQALAERRYISIEHRILWPDGTIRVVQELAEIVRDDDDNVVRVMGTVQDITESRQMERTVKEQYANLCAILENTDGTIASRDREGRLVVYNTAFIRIVKKLFGVEAKPGLKTTDHLPREQQVYWESVLARVLEGEHHREEFSWDFGDNDVRTYEISFLPIIRDDEIIGTLEFNRDITERKQAEEQLRVALREKEAMLQEIHHRVKNNLQVVSSLLDFQAEYVQDEQTLNILRDSQRRVKSMAMIHQQLYRTPDLSQIDFATYISNLATELFAAYRMSTADVNLTVDVRDVFLEIHQAVPCGLLLNELISNALKHAFPDLAERLPSRPGEVAVTFHRTPDGTHYTLRVSDNGVGLPPGFTFPNEKTLGLFLIDAFVEQLDGTIDWHSDDNGTTCTILFPISGE
ncbi:PAS domain S-box protein [candidate division KSB3 bacterium]|uniref:PAS domain S-box protein n=1 Tax=candidate division KSB3 bacterium TaxID=2044937 RepID=A0A9D5JSV3_9BACT|nr:PAS domain S-box protein [candidate division KSB3 bacterium]MBD3323628.1 PAS domain S-box protein [candidate division KSB3 bacterium]